MTPRKRWRPRGWSKFEVTVIIRTRDGEHELRVEGRRMPAVPAVTNLAPENCTPAEGGEIELDNVWMVRGKRERPLPDKLSDATEEAIMSVVEGALEDYAWGDY